MRYLKNHYLDQFLFNTACVSYGSPQLKKYGHALLIFLFFCEFSIFYSNPPELHKYANTVACINPKINTA